MATANNRFQPTVKRVSFFAKAKKTPLFTSSDLGVIHKKLDIGATWNR